MNNLYNKWIKGGLMGLTVVVGMTSCTDDHFDVKNGMAGVEGTNSSATLWQNISSVDNLSDFADILSKTKVTRSDLNTKSGITYKDLLSVNQNFTVWAPLNGSANFDAKKWLDLLANGDTLAVEKRFIRNHLARFNYANSELGNKRVSMLNTKVNDFDIKGIHDMNFKKVTVYGDSVVPSVNGTLYMLNGMANYSTNIYEYLKENPSLSDMMTYVEKQDTVIFVASASTPGATVNGQIHYVDSVFYSYNKMLGSSVSSEDSLYLAVYPTNKAWKEAIELVGSFYNYPTKLSYYDESNKLVQEPQNGDSLKNIATHSCIFGHMFFSLYQQPNLGFPAKEATVEKVKNFVNTADSLKWLGSFSSFLKEPKSIFDDVTPIEQSNGYAFVVDNYNYIPNKTWQDSTRLEYGSYYLDKTYTKNIPFDKNSGSYIVGSNFVTELTQNPKVLGKVSSSNYASFSPEPATANPNVSFKLSYLLSGTYDIYVTIVPMNITDSTVQTKPTRFTATLSFFDNEGKRITRYCKNIDNLSDITEVTTPSDKISDGCSYLTPDETQICRVKLFDNFKFPFAINNLSAKKISTVLTLSTNLSNRADRNKFTNKFNLDCIDLVGQDDGKNK
ncbi:MAG: hypothetical protein RR386_03315 [Bacteroidaceae bacterium]